MKRILLHSPLLGTGGIASWTRKFVETFPNDEFTIIKTIPGLEKNLQARKLERIIHGLQELYIVRKEIKYIIKTENVDIFHTTTSGSLGALRDYILGKICKNRGVKCIMHCRYGCIPQIIESKTFIGWLTLKSMNVYDQVWVLDQKSYKAIKRITGLSSKVYLTPNSISVDRDKDLAPKMYRKFVFMANLFPSKGIFELLEAFKNVNHKDTELHILGSGSNAIVEKVKRVAGDLLGKRIVYHGNLSNDDAIKLLEKMDSLVLPTYYPGEAFPISILEAMSQGKLVISTPRAAIADMITYPDGSKCGILVEEKSVKQLTSAIDWVCDNKRQADTLCKKAYKKVQLCYSTDVVYNLYRNNYSELFK